MKNKLIRCCVFILLLCILFGYANYRYTTSDYFRSIEGLYRYEDVPQNLEVINLGSSHGLYGLDYKNYPQMNCFNFAFASQKHYFDYALLASYSDHLSENCTVIIPVSYFTLYYPLEQGLEEQKARYYRILDGSPLYQMPNFNARDTIFYKYFPILSSQKSLLETFSSNSGPTYAVPDGVIEASSLEENAKKRAEYHLSIAGDQTVSMDEFDALEKLLALCRQKNWRVVLITTPLTEAYSDWFSTQFLQTFHSQLQNLLTKYPEATYLDYSHDMRFATNLEFFIDSDHLNQAGREYFTDILFEDLAIVS